MTSYTYSMEFHTFLFPIYENCITTDYSIALFVCGIKKKQLIFAADFQYAKMVVIWKKIGYNSRWE